jgi:hypothetical protein
MDKSSALSPADAAALAAFTPQKPDLEFPDGSHFDSHPPHLDPAVMFERCEQMLAYNLADPAWQRRRERSRQDANGRAEFVL